MRRFIFPTKDVSLYERYPNRQTGLDEILEVGKNNNGQHAIRSLIEFDLSTISQSISSGQYPKNSEFELKLYLARAEKLSLNQTIEAYPVSQSWVEGSGYFCQDIIEENNGATWRLRETSSWWANSGSSYHTSSMSSVTSSNPITDLSFDMTNIVRGWLSGSYPNYGIVLKYPGSHEIDTTQKGQFFLFSRNTHTVFVPTLITKWDGSTYSTGSLSAASSNGLIVKPINLKGKYKKNEVVRVNVKARTEYPEKTFGTYLNMFNSNQYLPTSSYYSIVDVQSQESIIPFDDYSKLSCDDSGSFFVFTTEKMYPLRYYKVLFKTVFDDGTQHIFDNNQTFKIDL